MDTENGTRDEALDQDTETVDDQVQVDTDATPDVEADKATDKDAAKNSLLDDLYSERTKRKELAARVKELEQFQQEATPPEKLTEITKERDVASARLKVLEELLQADNGNLGKLLDSRKYSEKLFNSEESVEDVLAEWNKSNPGSVGSALGSSAKQGSTRSMNDLLRAARG